jgi:hypothetical protein
VTDSDVCFEINIIDMYIKRAISPIYKSNGINIINLNIQHAGGFVQLLELYPSSVQRP